MTATGVRPPGGPQDFCAATEPPMPIIRTSRHAPELADPCRNRSFLIGQIQFA
jgi:hypothetical protein